MPSNELGHTLVAPVRARFGPLPRYLPPVGKAGIGDTRKVGPQLAVLSTMLADFPLCLRTVLPVNVGVRRSACARNGTKEQDRDARLGYRSNGFVNTGLRGEIVSFGQPDDLALAGKICS